MATSFPLDADDVVHTLFELCRLQGATDLVRVLRNAEASIEETDYDNWRGGTYFYTLYLRVPVSVYAALEGKIPEIEKALSEKAQGLGRSTPDRVLNTVVVTPAITRRTVPGSERVPDADTRRLWTEGRFRVFLSHISEHKVAVYRLKGQLEMLGASAFVAHADINPSLEWQAEITRALLSMDAMIALLTVGFHESKWTDQEVGFALARNVLTVPVDLGVTPYWFMGKLQALRGDLDNSPALANSVIRVFIDRPETSSEMRESLVDALENASSFNAAKVVVAMLEVAGPFTRDQMDRLTAAAIDNDQVANAFGVPERIRALTP
jgi:hypothetical protein